MNRLLCALMLAAIVGCESASEQSAAEITGGNPKHGPQAIQRYGCGACHTIKGVDGATALVGPPLSKLGARMYIAGRLVNTPENLIEWIKRPHALDPKTAMPDLKVSDLDARDIAAYLYTLQ